MSKAAPSHRWFGSWRGEARPARDDPADYGTAFGLDLSLNELAHEPPARAPLPTRRGWVQRLTGRVKPT